MGCGTSKGRVSAADGLDPAAPSPAREVRPVTMSEIRAAPKIDRLNKPQTGRGSMTQHTAARPSQASSQGSAMVASVTDDKDESQMEKDSLYRNLDGDHHPIYTTAAKKAINLLEAFKPGQKLTGADAKALREIMLQIQSKSLFDTVLTQQGHAMLHEDEETKLYVNADVHKVQPGVAPLDPAAGPSSSSSSSSSSGRTALLSTSQVQAGQDREKDSQTALLMADNFVNCELSAECRMYLHEHLGSLDFDVFKVHELSHGHSLTAVFWGCCVKLSLVEACKIDIKKLAVFLIAVENGYHNNSYHCQEHAADVVQGTFWFFHAGGLKHRIQATPPEMYAALVAAAIHDYDHPGCNNAFLCNTNHPLAIRYNDISVLENHHVSMGYQIINTPESDVFAGLDHDTRKHLRSLIVTTVLATDISQHARLLLDFQTSVVSKGAIDWAADPAARTAAIKMAVKCADVSNPTQPWRLYKQWMDRVMAEFYGQGDEEKRLGLPVSPFCDRTYSQVSKCQKGFMNFIVLPLFKAWAEFLPTAAAKYEQLLLNADRIKDMVTQEQDYPGALRRHSAAVTNMKSNDAARADSINEAGECGTKPENFVEWRANLYADLKHALAERTAAARVGEQRARAPLLLPRDTPEAEADAESEDESEAARSADGSEVSAAGSPHSVRSAAAVAVPSLSDKATGGDGDGGGGGGGHKPHGVNGSRLHRGVTGCDDAAGATAAKQPLAPDPGSLMPSRSSSLRAWASANDSANALGPRTTLSL